MVSFSDADLAAGQRRLREFLPAARAELEKATKVEAGSHTGRAALPYLTEDNALALVISAAPKGGWHADLLLKSVPPGVADILGTPTEAPCATFAEAEEYGRMILLALLQASKQNAENLPEPAPPVFAFHGRAIPLDAVVLDRCHEILKSAGLSGIEYDSAYALTSIERVEREVLPGGCGDLAFEALGADARARLLSALHLAAACQVLRYPPRKHRPPDTHRANASGAKH